jgi:Fur family peroxide stress response transcriptional regulator
VLFRKACFFHVLKRSARLFLIIIFAEIARSFILLMEMISNKNTRQTPQKRFIEEFLSTHFDHPAAEEIYEAASSQGLHLGLTTVYRILESLQSDGKVTAIKANGIVHYDWIRDDHYHFVCDRCGEIIDLQEDKDLFEGLAKRHEFKLLTLQGVVIHGLCPDCAKKLKLPKEENENGKKK